MIFTELLPSPFFSVMAYVKTLFPLYPFFHRVAPRLDLDHDRASIREDAPSL